VIGFARGLSRQVLLNAELALTMAHRKQVQLLEYRPHDRTVAAVTRQRQAGREMTRAAGDDRLVVFETRVAPVGRPESDGGWVRLEAGIRVGADDEPSAIALGDLAVGDRRMIEFWLAGQLASVIDRSPPGLRLSIPVSAEAQRARSFAQRLFPLIEADRILPQRLVVEIELMALIRDLGPQLGAEGETSGPVEAAQRFGREASAMQLAVAVTEFDGGWNSWKALRDVPANYVIPAAEIVQRAGDGDYAAIRALAVMAADAEDRGIDMIMPGVTNQLSDRALTQIGFAYRERGGQNLTV
jgi:EAL domain-containing protein (putative c-di-GMP-specific phosphodiesterase class I)